MAAKRELPIRRYFVGMATPSHVGMIDPHEDVGWLAIYRDQLVFFGDTYRTTIDRSSVKQVVPRPNAHSMVFLGGFVSVEGQDFRIAFEIRDEPTLWRNSRRNKKLCARLRAWLKGTNDDSVPG